MAKSEALFLELYWLLKDYCVDLWIYRKAKIKENILQTLRSPKEEQSHGHHILNYRSVKLESKILDIIHALQLKTPIEDIQE